MKRFLARLALAICMMTAARAKGAISIAALLPDTTKGAILIADLPALQKHWEQSEIGKLANDPIMQAFADDLREQLKNNGANRLDKLGLTLDELKAVVGGEIGVAMILLPPDPRLSAKQAIDGAAKAPLGKAIHALVADVHGHEKEAAALLSKIAAALQKEGGKLGSPAGDPIVVYTLPPASGEKTARTVAFVLKDQLLAASDDPAALGPILAGYKIPRKDSLAGAVAFRSVMQRCAAEAGANAPDLRWFIDPFGYFEAVRSLKPPVAKRPGPDKEAILKRQGFSAIQGIGGYVNFALGKYELLHRTAIYAPAVKGHDASSTDKYQLAARMMNFPNGGSLMPESWTPRDLVTHVSFNWNVLKAFDSSETLVDALMGQSDVFHDALQSLREDPKGPRVDVRNEIIANLGSHCAIVTDYTLPIDARCERKAFAVQTTKEKEVAAALEKLFGNDRDVKTHEFEGHRIYEIIEPSHQQAADQPQVKIEAVGFAPLAGEGKEEKDEDDEKGGRMLKNAAVCVARGYLFVSSHVEFLKKLLHENPVSDRLAAAADNQRVNAELDELIGSRAIAFRIFSRTDEAYRPTYELIRMGKLPRSETLLASMLNQTLAEGKNGSARQQRIDGKNLPEFEAVRRYFGPAGHFVTTEENGWFIAGFSLSKEIVKPVVKN